MSVVQRLARAVDTVLDRAVLQTEDPTALGLVRILVVSVMTASMLTHVGAVSDYFSDHALLGGEAAREAFHSRQSLFFYVTSPWGVRAVFALGVLAHLMWLVGLFTRVSAVVAWAVWASMVGRHPLLYALPDQLHGALCLLLALMPTGNGLSLDARRRGPRPVPIYCRRIVQLQLAVVYTATGLLKTGPTWTEDGTALYYALVNPYNRHFMIAQWLAALQPWVLRPATWLVLAWEVGFGGFVLVHWLREMLGRPRRIPDLRWVFLGFGVMMHVGIQSFLYVAWFTPLTIAAYSSFLRPEEVQGIAKRLRRLRRPRNVEEPAPKDDAGSDREADSDSDSGAAGSDELDLVDEPSGALRAAVAAEDESDL